MSERQEKLAKLQEYTHQLSQTHYHDQSNEGRVVYEKRQEKCLKDLDKQISAQKTILEDLRKKQSGTISLSEPSKDPRERLQQLAIIKSAYHRLSQEPPVMPPPDSVLPVLLASRSTRVLVSELEEAIPETHARLKLARARLLKEKAELENAELVQTSLKSQISQLHDKPELETQHNPHDIAQTKVDALHEKQMTYERNTKNLVRALVKFINEKLAIMLATEELGGPVVGDAPELTEEMLMAACSRQASKSNDDHSQGFGDGLRRQRTIERIWGPQKKTAAKNNPKIAAATEMRTLVEELLNLAAEEGPMAYLTVPRDSAGSRFLLRAKAVQAHPENPMQLRLVDFGSTIKD